MALATEHGLGGSVPPSSFFSFEQKRKKGKVRIVEGPRLEGAVVDTHAHLDMLAAPAENLARCAFHGVDFVCAMADPAEDADTTYLELERWRAGAKGVLEREGRADLTARIPRLRIAFGCHPHNAKFYDDALEALLVRRLRDPRTCALGEVGLDYHYDLSPREVQREVFRRQIRIAHEAGLPLILHMREAHDEGFAILKEEGFPAAGVLLHCFNLDEDVLAPWVEAGCHIAFGGPLTFKKADEVRASARRVPREKLLTETDSPYMTPEPLRGSICGPEHVVFTAARMAEVLGCEDIASRQALFAQVHDNALALLDRAPTAWQDDEPGRWLSGAPHRRDEEGE